MHRLDCRPNPVVGGVSGNRGRYLARGSPGSVWLTADRYLLPECGAYGGTDAVFKTGARLRKNGLYVRRTLAATPFQQAAQLFRHRRLGADHAFTSITIFWCSNKNPKATGAKAKLRRTTVPLFLSTVDLVLSESHVRRKQGPCSEV